jgi:hypothetical protein
MSQHRPALDNILATVRRFLETSAPQLQGEARYHAQVCAYLLAIGERELQHGAAHDAAERGRLAAILGHDGETCLLNAELATGLRAGRFDAAFPQVLDALLGSGSRQGLPWCVRTSSMRGIARRRRRGGWHGRRRTS